MSGDSIDNGVEQQVRRLIGVLQLAQARGVDPLPLCFNALAEAFEAREKAALEKVRVHSAPGEQAYYKGAAGAFAVSKLVMMAGFAASHLAKCRAEEAEKALKAATEAAREAGKEVK